MDRCQVKVLPCIYNSCFVALGKDTSNMRTWLLDLMGRTKHVIAISKQSADDDVTDQVKLAHHVTVASVDLQY